MDVHLLQCLGAKHRLIEISVSKRTGHWLRTGVSTFVSSRWSSMGYSSCPWWHRRAGGCRRVSVCPSSSPHSWQSSPSPSGNLGDLVGLL